MVEEDNVFKGKVKQEGLFEFKELYKFCHFYLVDRGYKLIEKEYSEKIVPNGKNIDIKWEAKRKISDYFRFKINFAFKIIGMTEVEVQKEGYKTKMNKGQAEIKIDGVLEKDYEHRWEDNPFYKFLRTTYDRYIIKTRIDEYEKKLLEEIDEMIAEIKAFLVLETHHR
jgi:hypothetical protein